MDVEVGSSPSTASTNSSPNEQGERLVNLDDSAESSGSTVTEASPGSNSTNDTTPVSRGVRVMGELGLIVEGELQVLEVSISNFATTMQPPFKHCITALLPDNAFFCSFWQKAPVTVPVKCNYGRERYMVYGKEAGDKIGTGTGCISGRPEFFDTDCKLIKCGNPECNTRFHHACQTRHIWSDPKEVLTTPDGRSITGKDILLQECGEIDAKRCFECLHAAFKSHQDRIGQVRVVICIATMH